MAGTIRVAEPPDADDIRDIYAPIVADTAISFETAVPNATEIRDRITNRVKQYPWVVYDCQDEIGGYAVAGPHSSRGAYQWTVDVSVYVRDDRRRKGIGTALYGSLLELLRLQGYVRACAVIALPNEASVQFHKDQGFDLVGVFDSVGYKQGAWRDVGWWQRAIRSPSAEPDPPSPMADLRGSHRLDEALGIGDELLEE